MSTALTQIPTGGLPAHLQSAAAAIAEYNAAAGGGIKVGGFPRISIKGGKFHIKKGGETVTITDPPQPGQPALPKMLLTIVVVAANPALTKTYYPGAYEPGDDSEPTCSSSDGIVPDAHIANKQSPVCATCPQNQWGSKVSQASGKEVKACSDSKQLAILPDDLTGDVLGLSITPAALGEWGKYIKALSDRGIPVNSVVTNLTFDATASFPKLQFGFNRFLAKDDYDKVVARAKSDEVLMIVKPAARPLQLAAPTHPTAADGFSSPPAAPPAPAPAAPAPAPAEPPKTRKPRGAKAAEAADPAPDLPAHVVAALASVGGIDTDAGKAVYKALTGKDYAPAAAAVDPLSHLPPEIKAAIMAVGGADSIPGKAILAGYPAPNAAAPATTAPGQGAPAATAPPAATPAAAAPTGFGATAPAAVGVNAAPSPAAAAAAGSLAELLRAKLAKPSV